MPDCPCASCSSAVSPPLRSCPGLHWPMRPAGAPSQRASYRRRSLPARALPPADLLQGADPAVPPRGETYHRLFDNDTDARYGHWRGLSTVMLLDGQCTPVIAPPQGHEQWTQGGLHGANVGQARSPVTTAGGFLSPSPHWGDGVRAWWREVVHILPLRETIRSQPGDTERLPVRCQESARRQEQQMAFGQKT
jgi:hypothetical protein